MCQRRKTEKHQVCLTDPVLLPLARQSTKRCAAKGSPAPDFLSSLTRTFLALQALAPYKVCGKCAVGGPACNADTHLFPQPARSAVEVARLPRDVGVEVECIAAVKSS